MREKIISTVLRALSTSDQDFAAIQEDFQRAQDKGQVVLFIVLAVVYIGSIRACMLVFQCIASLVRSIAQSRFCRAARVRAYRTATWRDYLANCRIQWSITQAERWLTKRSNEERRVKDHLDWATDGKVVLLGAFANRRRTKQLLAELRTQREALESELQLQRRQAELAYALAQVTTNMRYRDVLAYA